MKADLSIEIFNKYYDLKNSNVKILLRNKTKISGQIIGYFYGNEWENEPFIVQWHIVINLAENQIVEAEFGIMNGRLILQKDILELCFSGDSSIFKG